MSAQGQALLTAEQYLTIERSAGTKSEYYQGRMYAMSGASVRHVIINGNLSRELGNALKGRGCIVGTNDLRLEIAGLYTYPDLIVVCGEPRLTDKRRDTITNPTVIAEVLSPSTESYDRGFKFAKYREIETLQEYALISQVEPRVEIFRRQVSDEWLLSEAVGLDSAVRFDCLNCSVPLAEIYANVAFESEDTERPAP